MKNLFTKIINAIVAIYILLFLITIFCGCVIIIISAIASIH